MQGGIKYLNYFIPQTSRVKFFTTPTGDHLPTWIIFHADPCYLPSPALARLIYLVFFSNLITTWLLMMNVNINSPESNVIVFIRNLGILWGYQWEVVNYVLELQEQLTASSFNQVITCMWPAESPCHNRFDGLNAKLVSRSYQLLDFRI